MDQDIQESLQKQQMRGAEALKLLDNPLLLEFFQETEAQSKARWWEGQAWDPEGLKSAWEQKEAVKMFKQYLESYVYIGKNAQETLETMKEVSNG